MGNTLEKFISAENLSGKSRGENDRGHLTDFSVDASQSEIYQSSNDESICDPLPQKEPNRNIVNIDIFRASKDIFDNDINLLVPDAEQQDQLGKENSAANDLGIFEKINKEKLSKEELGPAISSQLAEMAMKFWSEEPKYPVVVNKILDGLKISANCSGVRVYIK